MSLEDDVASLREHIRELQNLIVMVIPDEAVARLDDLNLLQLTIAERSGTSSFRLTKRYVDRGNYFWFVDGREGLRGKRKVPVEVKVYVHRLRRMGLKIEVEETREREEA